MEGERPRVALDISTRLFRDVLARALAPHVDVIVVPDGDAELAEWIAGQHSFDVAIVSGGSRLVDVDAGLIVEVAPAEGQPLLGHVRGQGHAVRSLPDLLALLTGGQRLA